MTVSLTVTEFTDVFFAVGKREGALTVILTVTEFTDVFAAVGKRVGSETSSKIILLARRQVGLCVCMISEQQTD